MFLICSWPGLRRALELRDADHVATQQGRAKYQPAKSHARCIFAVFAAALRSTVLASSALDEGAQAGIVIFALEALDTGRDRGFEVVAG